MFAYELRKAVGSKYAIALSGAVCANIKHKRSPDFPTDYKDPAL